MYYKIFTTPNCPRCEQLKAFLAREGVAFDVIDMGSAESIAELLTNGIFIVSAPVLQVGDRFFTTRDLFDGDHLDESRAKEVLNEKP